MEWMFTSILVGAGLITLSILTSALAFRLGAPLLLVFLCIGLIAGEDGLGLVFNDAEIAYFIGSLALAVILFDSGFGTRVQTLQRAAAPAFILATLGVFLTTLLVAVAARFLFDVPWLYALLMGAIISSTDAAAVFFLLRAGGVKIYKRVRSVLEVESGSNDPMAIFLTVLFVEMIIADPSSSGGIVSHFLQGFGLQMGVGLVFGLLGGFLIVEIVNRINLEDALYAILVIACALCVFAITAYLGGSGFLAVYVAGVVAGNRVMKGASALRRDQEGMTWLAQIVMFLVLGLFVTPSEFGAVLVPALLLGLFLIFIGRPLAVVLCLLPFGFDRNTVTFNAWVGLRGAVSILLAILPAVMGIEGAELFINVAFIMVMTSLVVQGWTIKPAAQWLKLITPSTIGLLERIDLELPGSAKHELLIYRVLQDSPVSHGNVSLPAGVHVSLIVREGELKQPEQVWPPQIDDLVCLFSPPEKTARLDRLFSQKSTDPETIASYGAFEVDLQARMADLLMAYNIPPVAESAADLTVGQYMMSQIEDQPVVGDRIRVGHLELVVRRVHKGQIITEAGLSLTRKSTRKQAAWLSTLKRWFARQRPKKSGRPNP